MAKVSFVQLSGAEGELYSRGLRPGDRFVSSRIVRKDLLLSRKRKKGITQKSLLPTITALWNGLSPEDQEAWSDAGFECSMNGFRLFVRDTSYRIVNGIVGLATPSLLHQALVGVLHIEDPASEIQITQLHPRQYYVQRKISGTKSQYGLVSVVEAFSLPLTISLNYKSNLSVFSSPNFAKFYATIWHSYQGVDRFTNLEIPFSYSSDWQYAEATLSEVIGQVVGYSLFMHVKGLRGDVFFDNIKAVHNGQNWARDPFCQDIDQQFTKAFFQVPKHWAPVILPDGSDFESEYLSDELPGFLLKEDGDVLLQESGFKLEI